MKKIQFIINDKYWLENKELHPKPIKEYQPDWFKNLKPDNHNPINNFVNKIVKSSRSCPSFIEVYQEGFVVVAPVDYILMWNDEDKTWGWHCSLVLNRGDYGVYYEEVNTHPDSQFLDHISIKDYKHIFKINLPLKVVTPNGYSCRQLPIPYDNNKDFEAIYGIIRTDKWHEPNIQLAYKSTKQEIRIKAGTPLCVYAPFKREKFDVEIIDGNKKSNIVDKVYNTTKLAYGSYERKTKVLNYFKD